MASDIENHHKNEISPENLTFKYRQALRAYYITRNELSYSTTLTQLCGSGSQPY